MKKTIALLLLAAMLLALAACDGGKKENDAAKPGDEEETGSTGSIPDESAIREEYQDYLRRWLEEDSYEENISSELYSQLIDCIEQGSFETYPGSVFFDGSMAIGRAQTYDEYAEEARREAELLADPSYIHIQTPEDLQNIANNLGGRYILDNDIDDWWGGESTVFTPIGTLDEPFTGELFGNGHSITGTLAYTGQETAWGLFGCNEGYVHDLTIGYIYCAEMRARADSSFDTDYTYTSADEEDLPVETTQYFGVLCGVNRGTIENVAIKDRASMPEMYLYPNENDMIYLGLICARNEGTVSGITMNTARLEHSTLDRITPVAVGLVCGSQAADAVLENVSVIEGTIELSYWGSANHMAPAADAGILIGEAESGTTVRGDIVLDDVMVHADYSLADQDLRLGGAIGRADGDIALSGVEARDVSVRIDARTDLDDYTPTATVPVAGGGLIGWADGSVTVSDLQLAEIRVEVIRRRGGNPGASYAGGVAAFCGGDLSARAVTLTTGEDAFSAVEIESEQGVGYAGGLCGWCAGSAVISDSIFSLRMSPFFGGSMLYESNVLGYVCGDAEFTGVEANCGVDEYSGESNSHNLLGNGEVIYYLAALAGAAEGEVTAEGCVIDVHYSIMGTPGAVYGGGDEGIYNPA